MPAMASPLADAFWFVAVALCWGFTNPFIARGSKGVDAITHPSPIVHKMLVAKFLLTRWQYVVPLALNLSGSAVYYATLSHADLSMASPVTNSLTFLFTALGGALLGEDVFTRRNLAGAALVVLGVYFCVTSALESASPA